MPIRPENASVYEAFHEFVDRCIRGDRSLLWPPDQVWTLERVKALKARLIDTPYEGTDLSFEQKLQQQLRGADPLDWKMIADIYFVYFLPSSFITLKKKIHDIHWAAEMGGFQAPLETSEIWKAQQAGYTTTSQKYHSKYAQFWLITLFALHVKESGKPDEVLSQPLILQRVLDDILNSMPAKTDRAYDMRHTILYMTFPEHYERIISTRDKERIRDAYQQELAAVPEDLDQALFEIRQALPEKRADLNNGFDFYIDLRDEWRPKKRPPKVDDSDIEEITKGVKEQREEYSTGTKEVIDEVLNTLAHTRNVILYGPPGTGKTFFANKVAKILVRAKQDTNISMAARLQEVAETLTFHEIVALGIFMEDPTGRYTAPEIGHLPIVRARFIVSPVKHPNNQIWGYLQAHTSPESETVKMAKRSEPYLFDKNGESRWFLTDEGREYVKTNLFEDLQRLTSPESGDFPAEKFIEWVGFHQSFSYEEFIEGLRPITSEADPEIVTYQVEAGVFKRISTKAEADPENKYVLIIDEINRGNISKIFGELITLIEDDKRAGEPNALSLALAYSPQYRFSVPPNLYIIGTMNTADRSIALLDVALRRRFAFVEIMPDPTLLDGVVVESVEEEVDLGKVLRVLNRKIAAELDRDHQIGHSYFLKVGESDGEDQINALEFVWNHQVLPLLKEYFYSQPERLLEILAPMYPDVAAYNQENFMGNISPEFEHLAGDDLLHALAELARG